MKNTKKILLLATICIIIVFALASFLLLITKNKIPAKNERNTSVKEEVFTPKVPPYTISSRFGKIPVWVSDSENIYPESPTTLLNSGHVYYPLRSAAPELSRGQTVSVEGVYYVYQNSPRIDWAWNGNKKVSSRICLNKKLTIHDDTVIQAKVFIFPTPQEYCEAGEIKEYKILYAPSSLSELSKKFSPICNDITSFLSQEHGENPLKLYTCFGNVSPEGKFGEKFTHRDFEWLPFEGRAVIDIWAISEKATKENRGSICHLEKKGAVVLNFVSDKVEEIYMTKAEESCLID